MPQVSNLNGKVLNPLIDFNFILDTEIGLIRLIREQFQDDRAFKLDILNKSDRAILSLLYSRKDPNPLSVISTEDNIEHIDALYKSFMDNCKEEIIQRSVAENQIMSFVTMAINSEANFGLNITLVCADELEKKELSSHFNKPKIITYEDRDIILTKDIYYVKDFKFFTQNKLEKKIRRRKIYMKPYQYNIDYFENITNPLTSRNVFMLMGKDNREKNNDSEYHDSGTE